MKNKTRKMSVSEIQTMLGILELYDIPIQSMQTHIYEDCISILENKRGEYLFHLEKVTRLLSILAGK